MGTFNKLYTRLICPRCGAFDEVLIEMKFGDTRHMSLLNIGGRVPWIAGEKPSNGGRPENGTMVGSGYTECDHCHKDWWVRITVKTDVIEKVEADASEHGYATD